jgi:hypothetical protein
LREMATDVEMQQHFAARKRTHHIMMKTAQLSSIDLSDGDVVTIPLQDCN